MSEIENLWIFRITHYKNVENILKNGLKVPNSHFFDPNYVSIGDNSLILHRQKFMVELNPPNGFLGEYMPFYFGISTPMLLRIITGKGVKKYAQEDIVYLCCKLKNIAESSLQWFFTDGQANNSLTKQYNQLADLDKIDWKIVYHKDWKNTEEDLDKMRRKQAEFLIKGEINANLIERIVVFNEKMLKNMENIKNSLSLPTEILVNPKQKFYY